MRLDTCVCVQQARIGNGNNNNSKHGLAIMQRRGQRGAAKRSVGLTARFAIVACCMWHVACAARQLMRMCHAAPCKMEQRPICNTVRGEWGQTNRERARQTRKERERGRERVREAEEERQRQSQSQSQRLPLLHLHFMASVCSNFVAVFARCLRPTPPPPPLPPARLESSVVA